MRRILLLLALPAIVTLTACSSQRVTKNLPTVNDAVVYRAGEQEPISIDRLADELAQQDVVFLGEFHRNAGSHHLQLAILQALEKRRGKDLVLSIEHFERDTQPQINAFLRDKIGETHFIQASRAPGNYAPDIRPLMEFMKDRGLHVIASNATASLRRRISKGGKAAIKGFTAKEKRLVARTIHDRKGPYREKVLAAMGFGSFDMSKPSVKAMADRSYRAQCLWDDTMAESIGDYREAHPKAIVVHCVGAMHVEEGFGTVERLRLRQPKTKIKVVTPFTVENWMSADEKELFAAAKLGDYVYAVRPEPKAFVSEKRKQAWRAKQMAAHKKAHAAPKPTEAPKEKSENKTE